MATSLAAGRSEAAELAELTQLNARFAPVTLAGEQRLPVLDGLSAIVPGGGLQRGAFLSVHSPLGCGAGGTSLALALASGAAAAGSWVAMVGLGDLGLGAMADVGLALDRVVLVDQPPPKQWATVVAALFDAFELIIVAPGQRVMARDSRRLQARARERGSVVIHLSDGQPELSGGWGAAGAAGAGGRAAGFEEAADVSFAITGLRWTGLGDGHGVLASRQVEVAVSGRRLGGSLTHRLWLPNADGAVQPVVESSAGSDSTTRSFGEGGLVGLLNAESDSGSESAPLAPVVPIRAFSA